MEYIHERKISMIQFSLSPDTNRSASTLLFSLPRVPFPQRLISPSNSPIFPPIIPCLPKCHHHCPRPEGQYNEIEKVATIINHSPNTLCQLHHVISLAVISNCRQSSSAPPCSCTVYYIHCCSNRAGLKLMLEQGVEWDRGGGLRQGK